MHTPVESLLVPFILGETRGRQWCLVLWGFVGCLIFWNLFRFRFSEGFFLPVFFVFALDVVDPLSTSEDAAASGSSAAPRVLVGGPDASCGGKGFIEPSASLSTAPSTSSIGAGTAIEVAGELELGAVLLSAAVIPTTEFPGSSAPLVKVAELAWSTAVVVAAGTSSDVGSKGTSCCRNASMSGFRDAPDAAGVL